MGSRWLRPRLDPLLVHVALADDLHENVLQRDDTVSPGYETIQYTVRIKGDGTPEQFAELHEVVKKTSPNYFNVATAIKLESELVVE